jgi:hypothetical protein
LFLVILHLVHLCLLKSRRPVYRLRLKLGQLGSRTAPLNLGLMAAAELRHKRVLLVTDLMWIKLSEDKGLPENQLGEITAKSRSAELHAWA